MPPDNVFPNELLKLFGYQESCSLSYLVARRVLAEPELRLDRDGRRKRAWPRAYIDQLLLDPPPLLAKRLAVVRLIRK